MTIKYLEKNGINANTIQWNTKEVTAKVYKSCKKHYPSGLKTEYYVFSKKFNSCIWVCETEVIEVND